MNRQEKLQRLADQYSAEFAGQGYPNEFKAQGAMTDCNFGGKLIILSDSGDSCIVWSDWSDEAVSDRLQECFISYQEDPEMEMDEFGNRELQLGFFMEMDETFYSLNNFMRI